MQSIPPLIIPSTHVSTGTNPLAITDAHRRMVEEVGVTVYQLLELEPIYTIKKDEVKRKYAHGQPMVKPEEVKKLSTRMYELHEWYMKETNTTDRESLMVKARSEYNYHGNDLYVEFT